jgi:hypothetical protein
MLFPMPFPRSFQDSTGVVHVHPSDQKLYTDTVTLKHLEESPLIGVGNHPPAPVADVAIVDAPGVAPRPGDGTKTGETSLVETDVLVELAFYTNGHIRYVIGNPKESTLEHFEELRLVHRASMDEVLHRNDFMYRTGGKGGEKPCPFSIDVPEDLLKVKGVLHAVDSADGGTGPVGNECFRALADPFDSFNIMRSGDTPFDDGNIVDPIPPLAHGFPEFHKIQELEELEELLPEIGHLKLTSFAAGEVEKSNFWRLHHIAPLRSLILS